MPPDLPIGTGAAAPLGAKPKQRWAKIVVSADCRSEAIGTKLIFLDHDVATDGETQSRTIVSVGHALQKAGILLPRQVFTVFDIREVTNAPAGSDPEVLEVLVPCEVPYQEQFRERHNTHPRTMRSEEARVGHYMHMCEGELAGHVLELLVGVPVGELARKEMEIEVRRMIVAPAFGVPSWSIPEAHDLYELLGHEVLETFPLHYPGMDDDDFLTGAARLLRRGFQQEAAEDDGSQQWL